MKCNSKKEDFQKIKKGLEYPYFLVDYFLLCGIEPNVCLEDPDFFNEDKLKDRVFTPKILSKCPPFDKKIVGIDDGILDFCFPNGFKIKFSKKPLPSETFSIILDNSLSCFDYPQKYVTCFLFYESLAKYKSLETLINKQKKRDSITSSFSDSNISLDTLSVLSSSSCRSNFSALRASGCNIKNKNSQFYHCNFYYIPKCIVLVSIWPYINLHQKILRSIFQTTKESSEIPIEKVIQNLILEVPIPPRGIFYIDYNLINEHLALTQSGMNKLPKLDFSLQYINEKLNFNEIMGIIENILFDSKIVFFSKNVNLLTNIILGFLTLIYPFKYPFQVASCLPKSNYTIIEALSPYMLGIKESFNPNFFCQYNLDYSSSTYLFIDLDSSDVKLYKNTDKWEADKENPPLPKKITEALKVEYNKIRDSFKTSQAETKSLYIKDEKSDDKKSYEDSGSKNNEQFSLDYYNNKFQELFFDYMINIIRDYERYLNDDFYSIKNIGETSVQVLFKPTEFVKAQPSSDRSFYSKLMDESQMFSDFLLKKMIPKNLKDKVEVLFVNESINKKYHNSQSQKKTKFLESNVYEIKPVYQVQRNLDLSEEEYNWLLNNNESQLVNGQLIKIMDNSPYSNKKRIVFQYMLFPMLNSDLFFNTVNLNFDEKKFTFFENVDNASRDLLHTENQETFIEMENYVYLSWLEMWAFAFNFCDDCEKEQLFNDMIKVFDKVIYHEMEVLDMLFIAINNIKNDVKKKEMIQKLYKKMLQKKLNPDSYIHSIISGCIDNDSQQNAPAFVDNKKELMYRISTNENFRKRTVRISCEKSVLGETITFSKYYPCQECREDEVINLQEVSTKFPKPEKSSENEDQKIDKKIDDDVNWAYCKGKHYTLPKLTIQLGKELNTEGYKSSECTRTSTIDEVVLHSPHDLKINIKDGVFRDNNETITINDLKLKCCAIFWNCIWYFHLNSLPFYFMLPYEEDIFKFGDENLCENVLQPGTGYPIVEIKSEIPNKNENFESNNTKDESDNKNNIIQNIPNPQIPQKPKNFDLSKLEICHEIERYIISNELYFRFVTKSSPNEFNNSKQIEQRYQFLMTISENNNEISKTDFYELENFRSRYKLNQMKSEKQEYVFKSSPVEDNNNNNTDDTSVVDDEGEDDILNYSFYKYHTKYSLENVLENEKFKRSKSLILVERDKNENFQYRLFKNKFNELNK